MKNTTPAESSTGRVCRRVAPWALPVALATALSVSNGPAVGIGIGAAVAMILWLMSRR